MAEDRMLDRGPGSFEGQGCPRGRGGSGGDRTSSAGASARRKLSDTRGAYMAIACPRACLSGGRQVACRQA